MKLVRYHSPEGVTVAVLVSEGRKYIKLLIMASTPRIKKIPNSDANQLFELPLSRLNNVPRFLEFTRRHHNGSAVSEEVYNILYKGEKDAPPNN